MNLVADYKIRRGRFLRHLRRKPSVDVQILQGFWGSYRVPPRRSILWHGESNSLHLVCDSREGIQRRQHATRTSSSLVSETPR